MEAVRDWIRAEISMAVKLIHGSNPSPAEKLANEKFDAILKLMDEDEE